MNTRALPTGYTPPVPVRGRTLRTCRGLLIGSALPPRMPTFSADAELVQEALLDRRTAAPRPLLQRIAGAAWRWC
ncbi:hypothetical protein [Variovorax sp. RCC_210]|uniref:hypothetical protein n=1 Tax=Variovorax sp. RCC_210 TaxID=3239217 RepID=UPI00352693F5